MSRKGDALISIDSGPDHEKKGKRPWKSRTGSQGNGNENGNGGGSGTRSDGNQQPKGPKGQSGASGSGRNPTKSARAVSIPDITLVDVMPPSMIKPVRSLLRLREL